MRLSPVCVFGLAALASAQSPTLLVSGYSSASLHEYSLADGAALGTLAACGGAQSARYGPDGALYLACETEDRILRLDGLTGALLGAFVEDDPLTPEDETGGLDTPTAAVFGPDGNLYVADFNGDRVLRYDGATGAFLDVFVASGAGSLNGPDAGMCFGPDGHLYVPSFWNHRVLRYDGATGASLGAFVPAGSGSLLNPRMLRFRSDGWLYVSSWGNNRILRYNASGAFVDIYITMFRPTGFVFDQAQQRTLVCNDQNDLVRSFDLASGAPLATLVPNGSGGLNGATFLELLPDPELRLGRLQPGLAGAPNALQLRGGPANGLLVLGVGTLTGSLQLDLCAPIWLGVLDALPLVLATDANGEAALNANLGAGLAGQTLALQAYDPFDCRLSNLVLQTL